MIKKINELIKDMHKFEQKENITLDYANVELKQQSMIDSLATSDKSTEGENTVLASDVVPVDSMQNKKKDIKLEFKEEAK